MATLVLMIGVAVAATLLTLLLLTLKRPSLRFWPTPGPGSWQNLLFWPLFRGLNVLCIAAAAVDRTALLGLPLMFRAFAALCAAAATAGFLYAFIVLGRDKSYGARGGLVTTGIYRWSRNPQNALLAVVYACLAIAADSASAYLLCAAMVVVYVLMVLAEEPWLAAIYGAPYRSYCRRVPRFFNWRRASLCLGAPFGRRPVQRRSRQAR